MHLRFFNDFKGIKKMKSITLVTMIVLLNVNLLTPIYSSEAYENLAYKDNVLSLPKGIPTDLQILQAKKKRMDKSTYPLIATAMITTPLSLAIIPMAFGSFIPAQRIHKRNKFFKQLIYFQKMLEEAEDLVHAQGQKKKISSEKISNLLKFYKDHIQGVVARDLKKDLSFLNFARRMVVGHSYGVLSKGVHAVGHWDCSYHFDDTIITKLKEKMLLSESQWQEVLQKARHTFINEQNIECARQEKFDQLEHTINDIVDFTVH